jgi:hypothetical protein
VWRRLVSVARRIEPDEKLKYVWYMFVPVITIIDLVCTLYIPSTNQAYTCPVQTKCINPLVNTVFFEIELTDMLSCTNERYPVTFDHWMTSSYHEKLSCPRQVHTGTDFQCPAGARGFVLMKPVWARPPFRVVTDCKAILSLGPHFADTSETRNLLLNGLN